MKGMMVISVLLYTTMILNAQNDSITKKLKGFKIGFGYGESYYANSQSGKTLSLDITAPLFENWQITAFGERNTKFNRSIDKHRHVGIVIGQKFIVRNRLEFTYGTGIGYILRSTKEHHSVPNDETGQNNESSYSSNASIDECKGLSIPLKLGIDFKVLNNISVGIYTRSTFYNKPVFGTANASLSMHF